MDSATALLLAGHLTATASMAGIIWFVQVVHYPLFPLVGGDRFVAYDLLKNANIAAGRSHWSVSPCWGSST